MTEVEKFALEQIKGLVPEFQKLEFRSNIGDTSRVIVFSVWINGEKVQCYDLADRGVFPETALEKVFDTITTFIRHSGEYKKGEANKLRFEYEPVC